MSQCGRTSKWDDWHECKACRMRWFGKPTCWDYERKANSPPVTLTTICIVVAVWALIITHFLTK